jgi:hypothetical protein
VKLKPRHTKQHNSHVRDRQSPKSKKYMRKKMKNKNINMFVRNNGKKSCTCALSSTLCGQKGKKHKVTLFMGPKRKKH